MDVCPDYEDLFKSLNRFKIKYLVIGAHAVIYYTEPRYTKDIDVWIPAELNDPEVVYKALKDFGAPLTGMTPRDFQNKKTMLQIGVAPVRIDILIGPKGVSAENAWKNRKKTRYGRTPIFVLGLVDLRRMKRSARRAQDMLDLDKLAQWHPKRRRAKKKRARKSL